MTNLKKQLPFLGVDDFQSQHVIKMDIKKQLPFLGTPALMSQHAI
jgi:hypothetical protein